MLFNYLDKDKEKFFFKKDNKMIYYKYLYSGLIDMEQNNLTAQVYIMPTTDEEFELKIVRKLGNNKFEFRVDNSPILYINGQKKVFFVDKDGNVAHQIYVFNKEQLLKFQMYLMEINGKKNVDFFDISNNLIVAPNNDKLFDLVHHLKIKEDNVELEEKQNEDYYKNIFDKYIQIKFSNDGEKLSFNLDKYSNIKESEFKYFETNSRNELFDSLQDFINSQEHYIAFTGLSGTGKTITLLKFLDMMSQNYPNCYFNIKSLTKISNIKILASEFVKLFPNDYLYDDYIKLIHQIEKKNHLSIWDKIIEILDFIIKLNMIKEQIIIIIDQYKTGYDPNLKLIEILQSDRYKNIKFIICSSVHENDARSSITYESTSKKLKLSSILIYKFINKLFSVKSIIKNEKIKEMMELFNFIPKYYYLFINNYHPDIKEVENEDDLKKKIEQFLSDRFEDLVEKLNSFFLENHIDIIKEYYNICQILQGEALNEIDMIYAIQKIPLKYSIYGRINDNFTLKAAFDFIYGPLRKVYKKATIPNLINVGKIAEHKNRGEFGNIFDSLVNYHFDLGKNIFGLEISHVIIVNEIVNFSSIKKIINQEKDYFIDKINFNKLFDKKVIYLEQLNSNGQCVDGGFLIPIPNSDSYALLVYQSSIRKRKHFSKAFIYNYIYKTTKKNINEQFGITIEKIYFMYIIDKGDERTIKYCNESDIYYIFYDYDASKFFYGNQKEINEFNVKIYEKMEIYEPNLKMIKLFQNQEASTDLSLFKKFYLGKKRENDDKGEENNDNKKYDIKTLKKLMIKTKNGYKNKEADLITGNINDYENNKNKINPSQKEKTEVKKIPKEWKSLFKEYNSYQIIMKNTNVCSAVFSLPVFYIYSNKYLIIKNDDEKNGNYSFYNFKNGVKLKSKEFQEAINSLNIFSEKREKSLLLDAYY